MILLFLPREKIVMHLIFNLKTERDYWTQQVELRQIQIVSKFVEKIQVKHTFENKEIVLNLTHSNNRNCRFW